MAILPSSLQNTPLLHLLSLTTLMGNTPKPILSFSTIPLSLPKSPKTQTTSTPPPPPLPKTLTIPPPPNLPPSALADLSNDGIAIIPDYACPDTVALLRFDALRLEHAGLVESAGTLRENVAVAASGAEERNGNEDDIDDEPEPYRKCKHFWLSGKKYVGPSYLLDLVSIIQDAVEGTSPLLSSSSSEGDGEDEDVVAAASAVSSSSSLSAIIGLGDEESLENGHSSKGNHRDVEIFNNGNDSDDKPVDEDGNTISHPIHRKETEVAYLYYEKGGYFHWHFDTPDAAAEEPSNKNNHGDDNFDSPSHRRAFSFLLYLGGHRPDPKTGGVAPWDEERDGGELRVYPEIGLGDQWKRIRGEEVNEMSVSSSNDDDGECWIGDPTGIEEFTDIVPREGTLVIFKSEAICHEVLRTNRERLAVVGWIHGDLR
mmetsp:Transcript_15399/g.30083  ORF Transcript_15399/g.30083 Transcript_15399/m.30083 type:complete len:428 (-) Transcript_15399:255-1538(-)